MNCTCYCCEKAIMKKRFVVIGVVGLLVALVLFGVSAASAQPTPIKRIELYKYNLNATTETFFILGPSPGTAGTALIQATASTTVTAVSGTPFADLSVGDMLIITNSNNVVYLKTILAKASSTSITVSLPAITLTTASFRWRKLASGTSVTSGSFSATTANFTIQIDVDQISVASGGIDIRVQCRANQNAAWSPAYPTAVAPAAQGVYNVTGVYSYPVYSQAAVDACRVGLKLSGADDATDAGTDAEQVSISTIWSVQ